MSKSTAAGQVLQDTSMPVTAPMVARVVPLRRDTTYDPVTETASMPVEIQFRDGTTARTNLVMNGSQLYAADMQTSRAINAREATR